MKQKKPKGWWSHTNREEVERRGMEDENMSECYISSTESDSKRSLYNDELVATSFIRTLLWQEISDNVFHTCHSSVPSILLLRDVLQMENYLRGETYLDLKIPWWKRQTVQVGMFTKSRTSISLYDASLTLCFFVLLAHLLNLKPQVMEIKKVNDWCASWTGKDMYKKQANT